MKGKIIIYLLIAIVAMAGMAGTAAANPSKITISPVDLVIIPDGSSNTTANVKVWDIAYANPDFGTPHNRTITVQTSTPGLEARVSGNGADTDWTSTTQADSQWIATGGDFNFDLKLRGTTTGSVTVTDNAGDTYDLNFTAADASVETDFVEVPEFPTIALPVAAIIGLAFFLQRRKEE